MPVDTLIGVSSEKCVFYMQGTWKDGTLCGWPDCKAVHPIKEASDFLGSYFNDDGVNLMHDNFFAPMARETGALLGLAEEEAADFCVTLHAGGNYGSHLPPVYYLSQVMQKKQAFSQQLGQAYERRHLPYTALDQIAVDSGAFPPPSFNLMSALHHVCGGISVTFESNVGLDAPGVQLTADEILDSHMVLFEQMMRFCLAD